MKPIAVRLVPVIVAVASLLAGCTSAAMTPSASVTTTMQGWEHYFRLEWAPQAKPNGTEIDGYIYNKYGRPMGSVSVLAQALDAANNVVAQRIAWVSGGVPALNRSYFRVAGLPPADQYRVSVWSFDIIDSGPWDRF